MILIQKKCIHVYRIAQVNNKDVIIKEEFEDIKGIIRIRKAKKDGQHNGQTTIYKTYT
jgi:hypothetical protein